jgi:hypothetical protein
MSEDIKILQMDSFELSKKITAAQEHISAAVSRFNRLRYAKKQLDKKITKQKIKENK